MAQVVALLVPVRTGNTSVTIFPDRYHVAVPVGEVVHPVSVAVNVPDAKIDTDAICRSVATSMVAGSRALARVPLLIFVAFSAVRFAPLAAGSVAGKRASGTVPLVNCVAFSAVRLDPFPLGARTSVPITNPRLPRAVDAVTSERLLLATRTALLLT